MTSNTESDVKETAFETRLDEMASYFDGEASAHPFGRDCEEAVEFQENANNLRSAVEKLSQIQSLKDEIERLRGLIQFIQQADDDLNDNLVDVSVAKSDRWCVREKVWQKEVKVYYKFIEAVRNALSNKEG